MSEHALTTKWLLPGAIFLLFVFDRLEKFILVRQEDFLMNDYTNEFIAFGIELPTIIIYTLIILVMTLLLKEMIFAFKKKKESFGFLIAGILLGGVSNLIDRLLYGGVIDYIQIVSWFPVFNLADLLITLSVIGVGLNVIKGHPHANSN